MTAPVTRIDAIRYARHERPAAENFARPVDDHDLPMPLDYYIWAIHRDGAPPVIVDTGFGEAAALARGRELIRPVGEGLLAAGIDHLGIEDVILTHLHYDHAEGMSHFPNARFHVQEASSPSPPAATLRVRDPRPVRRRAGHAAGAKTLCRSDGIP